MPCSRKSVPPAVHHEVCFEDSYESLCALRDSYHSKKVRRGLSVCRSLPQESSPSGTTHTPCTHSNFVVPTARLIISYRPQPLSRWIRCSTQGLMHAARS